MTIGRTGNRSTIVRQRLARTRRRRESRRTLLESLESRQLMAVGPQLISIQPNEGELIREGQVLHISPNEIVVRFDDSTMIDASTIANGIQISRSGGDGAFDRAYVSSDLGTNGAVVVDFAAAVPGQTGNGLQVTFTKVARTNSRLPVITVFAQSINFEVNTTAGLETRAQDLLTAFNGNSAAKAKMIVTRLRGSEFTTIANSVSVTQPLVLGGANTARASSNLNAGSNVQVEFLAAQSGPLGLSAQLEISSRDFGGAGLPIVTASGNIVRIQTNSSAQFRTTVDQFISAINGSAAAANILQARLVSGSLSTPIGVFPTNNPAIKLTGVADTLIKPGYIGLGDTGREVIIRFAEALPDDSYRIDILGRGVSTLKNANGEAYNNGVSTSLGFVLDLGVRIESVVPQPIPIERQANGSLKAPLLNIIHVYFDKGDLSAADVTNPRFYQLRYTNDKITSEDDQAVYPRVVRYNAEAARAELEFARNLDDIFASAGGKGAFRLRIGSTEGSQGINFALPGPGTTSTVPLPFTKPTEISATTDPGSRFDTATNIAGLWTPSPTGPSSVILSSEIKNPTPYQLDFPGADTEPGNREIRYQKHVTRVDTDGIEVIEYNFQGLLGTAGGSLQLNAITDDQKELVRRIVSLYENYLGVRFIETATRGITVAVGDMRAINPISVNRPGFPFVETGPLLSNGQAATIVDIQDFNSANQNTFGSDLFRTFARGIGNLLGLGTADEVPGLTVQSNNPVIGPGIDTELVFPGNADIVYGQNVHRPEGKDIDLYSFRLPVSGKIKIEISAERLGDSSLLDAALQLYQNTSSGWKEIAVNDDYFSQDSFVSLDLGAGEYMVGVSAKGNQAYDPNIEDSGLGGRSEGKYELRMDFRPPENQLMREAPKANQSEGTALDGDSDGRPGGIFDFWFIPSGPANTFYVDKAAPGTATGTGSIATPFRKISDALSAAIASPIANRIIRIVGNGGADGLIQTPADNLAYEIGFNRLGQVQADGTTFDIPKNVTVIVDAGAIVKLTRARIGVGSTTISVDRSGSALQVLGTPRFIDSATGKVIVDSANEPIPGDVYFTSINDTIGKGTNKDTVPPAPGPGDWGGIDIRSRIDASLASSTRQDKESQGLFLNSIVHGNLRYGGGQVIVDGVSQVITPIHMVDSRPAIGNSFITRSADAAMSATPNSFKESNFQDPITQSLGALLDPITMLPRHFIADFDRVGPDIHNNRLLLNSVNGLFVKTRTGAASTTEVMSVPGRFDDLDIVHVISENLIVRGTAGGATATSIPPISSTLGLSTSTVLGLTNGISAGTYRYRLAFITNGVTGPASSATTSIVVPISLIGTDHQIRLTALPSLAPNQRLAIYRATVINNVDGDYRLVGITDATQSEFVDQIATLGLPLGTTPNTLVAPPSLASTFTASAVPGFASGLSAGTYAYLYRYVAADGSESPSTQATNGIVVLTSPGVANGRVDINNLPAIPIGNMLRIYRAPVIAGIASNYTLVGVINSGTRSFIDVNIPVRLTPPVSPAPASEVLPPVMISPSSVVTTFTPLNAPGSQLGSATYLYQFAFVAPDGSESTTVAVRIAGAPIQVNVTVAQNQVLIGNLPTIPADRTLRVYRAIVPTSGLPVYELVGIVAPGIVSFADSNLPLTLSPVATPDVTLLPPPVSVQFSTNTNTLTNALSAGSYVYRFSFVSATGESQAIPIVGNFLSTTVALATAVGVANGQVQLDNLPSIPAGQSLRIYRATVAGGAATEFFLLTTLSGVETSYLDITATPGALLNNSLTGPLKARLNGSLVVDPGTVMKFRSSRIEVQSGGQLLAEGSMKQPIVMTSINDIRYGAGGTFDTANRVNAVTGVNQTLPIPGNWGGLYIGQGSTGSLDYVRLNYGGGTTRIEGGFASFNAIEGHQAQLRVANSRLENNGDGVEDGTPIDRAGRGTNFTATVFIRGSQPIIVDNRISDNQGAAINVDVDSLNSESLDDYGRSTGLTGKIGGRPDNQGPLIEENRLKNNGFNGMMIRGQTLTTESVWDDADIVHIVRDEVISENLYTYGGLRLKSKPTTSLVVKFAADNTNGLTASGRNLDITDRIGGSVQIVGQPGFPVILTTLTDDSVGAGFTPNGLPNVDTNNDGLIASNGVTVLPTGPEIDNGILIDNDVLQATPGFFSYQPQAGGGNEIGAPAAAGIGLSSITAQGLTQVFTNFDAIFDFINYIDVGSDGIAVSLASTTITMPPTLVSPDLVVSEGTFVNANGDDVTWHVESRFDNGISQLFNTLTFTSATPLGNIRYINYLDEDVASPSDDILFTRGTPGQSDFRVFTVDGAERFGFAQGGIYTAGTGLQNASYAGWAADQFASLRTAIAGAGTQYTLAGNINAATLPLFNDPVLGSAFGPTDVTSALAWDIDPAATTATITTFLELLPQEVRGGSRPGEWRGLRFDTESNDRNVAVVSEREPARSTAQAINDTAARSQLLGTLSSNAKSGDENARLGFQIQGTINQPSDKDVYSFYAVGGTEVWLDIDRTSNNLDTVVELIDADGRIVALSDNSYDEEINPNLLYRSDLPANSVNPLRKTAREVYPSDSRNQPKDLYSTNPKDAGMRVVLPGPTNQTTIYHVRVRSSNAVGLNDADRINQLVNNAATVPGRSRGAYQLQIRLREADEFPGSSVTFADIRFASTGIDLAGVPRHSPLLGETAEIEVQDSSFIDNIIDNDNDSVIRAENLGNLLDTDRATLSLAGSLSSSTDVDWYTFNISYNLLNTQLAQYFSTVFDIDYADGIGRPDTSMYLYNSTGNLLSFGLSSNILDDRAGALRGADNTDLGRGSSGTLDPFIGATELRAGQYFLAVTNQAMIPLSLLVINDTNTGDPLIRRQPANGGQWLVEDRVEQQGGSTALPPIVPSFLPVSSAVPFSLSDVALYLSQDLGISTALYVANPRTGNITNVVGNAPEDFQDIAVRHNGDVRAFNTLASATGGGDRDNLINYYQVNDGTAALTPIGQSGIQTQQLDLQTGNLEPADVGIEFNAITFANFGAEVGIAIGNRAIPSAASLNGVQATRPAASRGQNLIYLFNPDTGTAFNSNDLFNIVTADNPGPVPDIILGAGTDVQERGFIETIPLPGTVSTSLLFPEATSVTGLATTNLINDGDSFTIATPGIARFEFNSGPQFSLNLNPDAGPYFLDGDRFIMDGQVFEIQTNSTPVAALARPVNYLTTMTNVEFAQALQTAMDLSGPQFTLPGVIPVVVSQDGNRINFSGALAITPIQGTSFGRVATLSGNGSVTPGTVPIPFLARDTADDIASKAANAINSLGFGGLSASASGRRVSITGGNVTIVIGGVRREGISPGGVVRGVASFPDGAIYAVSDAGGLYFVNNSFASTETFGQVGSYVTTSTELIGLNFTGLTPGPRNVEGGRYANLMFATTTSGDIVAFDRAGNLQPVFAGGANRISTGIFGLTGLSFSNLDYNLWHQSASRGNDAGHGRPGTPDGVVAAATGGQSWYFGFEGPTQNGVPLVGAANISAPTTSPRFNAGPVVNTYNFAGGALGSLESQPISLADVSPADLPNFYFTYYSTIESVFEANRDVLRVEVMGDNGVWQTVIANNTRPSNIQLNVPTLFNNDAIQTSWRQARIDLAPFAGNREVRFRFQFSTGDGMGNTRGADLRTVAGSELLDGNTFTLSGRTFEIDLGSSLIVPSGARMVNNSTIQVGGTTFVLYNGTGPIPLGQVIPFESNQTASQVSQAIVTSINQALLPLPFPQNGVITANVVGSRVQVTGGTIVTGTGSFAVPGSIVGAPGVSVGRIPVVLRQNMSSAEVATVVQRELNNQLAGGSQVFPLNGDIITLTGLTVNNSGPFTSTNSAANNNNRAIENNFEGIYLDDFVIGFAERGEGVIDPVVNQLPLTDIPFVLNPNRIGNAINVGPYQLEIRGGEEYLTPTTTGLSYSVGFTANERLSIGSTVQLTSSDNILDGDYIDIGDGVRTLRFVFKNTALNSPLLAGEIAIPFTTSVVDPVSRISKSESSSVIASRLRDLINSPSIQSQLNVTAISINGVTTGLGGASIALSSNAIVNPRDVAPRIPIASVIVNRRRGDSNTTREQGQIVIENSKITNSENFGILLRADDRTSGSNNPNPGAVRNTVVLNNERLAPGAVIVNNELTGNVLGGISIAGDVGATMQSLASVPFARIINNTIVGGSITQPTNITPAVFNNTLFGLGVLAFADRIPVGGYAPAFSGGPSPIIGFNQPNDALGNPNYSGDPLLDPAAFQGAVSLGSGGRLVVEFTDNILTGSGDARPDLAVFEVGLSERVAVEVSTDGLVYRAVGFIDGVSPTIDLDFYGYNRDSRLRFVRMTDVISDGPNFGDNVGADIDAVGAISSISATLFQAGGVGIQVGPNASPTLLNNILVNNATAISVDALSASTVVGGSVYQKNTNNFLANGTVEKFPIVVPTTSELFVDIFNRRLYPRAGALTIDSSVDSLLDRAGLVSVKTPLGLQQSPILAPDIDLNGLLRVDDPTVDTPSGLGENVFKDRGAQDRSDFTGPTAVVIDPIDNDVIPADINSLTGIVELSGTSQPYFDIRFFDGGDLQQSSNGVGVDPNSVNSAAVLLTKDGVTLIEGVDYRFGFDATSNVIRLTPIGGVWPADSVYQVRFIKTGQSVIPLKSTVNTNDGTTYTIVNDLGTDGFRRFELDLGVVLTVPQVTNGTNHAILDGGQFILTQGTLVVVFEFDENAAFASNAIPIFLLPSDTPTIVVNKMIAAIKSSGLVASVNLLGSNRIQILGAGLTLTSITANLTRSGNGGVLPGTIAVPLDASLIVSAVDVARVLTETIRNAGIPGVTVTQIGSNVLVEGAISVVGEGATVVQGITDRAGNPLRENQNDGTTVLTIQIGAGFDYGDAPDPIYSTLKNSNGPRHSVVDGYYLGAGVTADADARPNNTDSDDGVAFGSITQGYISQLTVTAAGVSASRSGYLSAWVDFNRNGVFEDSERITNSSNDTMVNGSNVISFIVPGATLSGSTIARFRYSSVRTLTSTGDAIDGEVEDWSITIGGNPYTNQINNLDVNRDGFVSPIDALQVINFLARNGTSTALVLPRPGGAFPPFIDVNGDGFASPIDVLLVINAINRASRGAGEGEGALDASESTWIPASQSTVAAPSTAPTSLSPSVDYAPPIVGNRPENNLLRTDSFNTPNLDVGHDSVWASVAYEKDALAMTFLDDRELSDMCMSKEHQANSSSSLDDPFSDFEGLKLL
ncbi:MAG: dockerin type I domain-containing protein [Pirellulaceae bacterium]|nr:dockerin type I domain-containing protein [Pirellulaceae bacterium]